MNLAQWIWGGAKSPRPTNAFRLFRREFELAAPPTGAQLCVSAEWRYKLYINGEFVQIGPMRGVILLRSAGTRKDFSLHRARQCCGRTGELFCKPDFSDI